MLSLSKFSGLPTYLAAAALDRDFRELPQVRHIVAALRRPSLLKKHLSFCLTRTISEQDHIFVVGPPGSGTTLVSQILRVHPSIASLDLEAFALFFRWSRDDLVDQILYNEIERIIECSRDVVDLFDRIALYVCSSNQAIRFLDKTPENALKMPFLRRHFPNSKIVFVIRDGRDGFLSSRRHPGLAARGLGFYARLWKLCARARIHHFAGCQQIVDVKYEKLCAQPEVEVGRVMSLLNEDFVENQISSATYSRTSLKYEAGHERLEEPITDRSVGAWRNGMSDEDLRTFHQIAGRELRLMGYDV